MKKILIALLVAVLCLSVVACAGDNTPADTADESTVDTSDNNNNNDNTPTPPANGGDNKPAETNPPAPEVEDEIGAFKEIVPGATEDKVDDSYEWIG